MYNGYVASQYVELVKKYGVEWLITLYQKELKNKGYNTYSNFMHDMALNQIKNALEKVGVNLC